MFKAVLNNVAFIEAKLYACPVFSKYSDIPFTDAELLLIVPLPLSSVWKYPSALLSTSPIASDIAFQFATFLPLSSNINFALLTFNFLNLSIASLYLSTSTLKKSNKPPNCN